MLDLIQYPQGWADNKTKQPIRSVMLDLIQYPQGRADNKTKQPIRSVILDLIQYPQDGDTPRRAPTGHEAHVIADLIRNPEGQGGTHHAD